MYKRQVKETGEKLELATTRPETMLGDTAVQYEIEHNIAYGVNTAHLDTKGLKKHLD